METIGIASRFFTHELNNYSDWKTSFWRELVQNSVDVNCRTIKVSVIQTDGACEVEFIDDGPGMDEATLRDVYFQLGATGKENADTIGGHGRARILTCFAHQSYEIRTQTVFCKGSGGAYEINNQQPFFRGCSVKVRISEAPSSTMEDKLEKYLGTCQLPCEVFVNEERFTNWLYKRKATRQLTFGSIHTNKNHTYQTIIRVRGVTMFQRYSGCELGTILEVEASKARNILPVSRDNLKHEEQRELDDFLAEITVDKNSLKRDCNVNKTEIFGKFRKNKKRELKELKEAIAKEAAEREERMSMRLTGESHTVYHGWDVPHAAYMPMGEKTDNTQKYIPDEPEPEIPFSVHYEDASRIVSKAAKNFEPGNIKGNRLKLLAAWDATVEFMMEEMEDWRQEEYLFLPGFVFGDPLGLYRKETFGDSEGHVIHINPIDSTGKIRISCHDIGELYAIAVHECAHILRHYHDETHSAYQTILTQRTAPKIGELKNRIRAAVAAVEKRKKADKLNDHPVLPHLLNS